MHINLNIISTSKIFWISIALIQMDTSYVCDKRIWVYCTFSCTRRTPKISTLWGRECWKEKERPIKSYICFQLTRSFADHIWPPSASTSFSSSSCSSYLTLLVSSLSLSKFARMSLAVISKSIVGLLKGTRKISTRIKRASSMSALFVCRKSSSLANPPGKQVYGGLQFKRMCRVNCALLKCKGYRRTARTHVWRCKSQKSSKLAREFGNLLRQPQLTIRAYFSGRQPFAGVRVYFEFAKWQASVWEFWTENTTIRRTEDMRRE